MAKGRDGNALRDLHALLNVGTVAGLTDGELLGRFAARRGETAEMAFAALVERHGPMVLRVCRRVLADPVDAQDAYQATFLILVRRAGSIRERQSVGSWLHGVAYRVAHHARADSIRRRRHERLAAERAAERSGPSVADDLGPVLHEEIGRLPERYRAPIVLCYLEGRTHEQAAHQLGWPVGTVRSRLARGRERLRGRLERRGLGRAVAMLGAVLASEAPAESAHAWIRAVLAFEAGQPTTPAISVPALTLAKGVSRKMLSTKLKMGAAALLAGGCLVTMTGPSADPIIRAAEGRPPGGPMSPTTDAATGTMPPPQVEARHEHGQGDPPIRDEAAPGSPIPADQVTPRPWETTVRIKAQEFGSVGFGTGTIISSDPDRSIILTRAHTYRTEGRRDGPPTKLFSGRISVDLFEVSSDEPGRLRLRLTETLPGEVIDLDPEQDVGLIRIRPGRTLPASPVVPRTWSPQVGTPMLTVGCSEGNDPTAWSTEISGVAAQNIGGRDLAMIECRHAPKQGRAGGGLFTRDGRVAGVCNYSVPSDDVGLYAAPQAIQRLLDRNGLTALSMGSMEEVREPKWSRDPTPHATGPPASDADADLDRLMHAVGEELARGNRSAARDTIGRLEIRIRQRRKALLGRLARLDSIYLDRLGELRRAAADGSKQEGAREPDLAEPTLSESPSESGRRLRDVEKKLDVILKALEGSKLDPRP